jgi:hypothetical protein
MGLLGVGGMGEVYRARDDRLRLRRFEVEARAAGSLNHPNIVTIYDIGAHSGSPYVVQELLEGPDLSSIGLQRSVKHLREAILNPSLRLTEGYQPATVPTSDGRTLRGLAKGRVHLLQQADWRGVELSLDSPMPSDYARRLTPAEIDDLLTFLSRQAASGRD